MRGQVNMADEARLCRPIHSTFQVLLVPSAVGHCHGKELSPFCWPKPAVGTAAFGASHPFAEHASQNAVVSLGLRKLQWIRLAADHQTVTMTLFLIQLWLWEVFFKLPLGPTTELVTAGCSIKPTFHPMSQFKPQSRNSLWLFHRIRENDALKWWFFWFVVGSQGTHLSSFFTFLICFKCQVTVEWLTLIFWATSHVVVRGPASMITLSWSLWTSNGWPPLSSPLRLSSPLQNFLNHHCTECSLAVSGPMHCWCCELSPLLYDLFWIQIRKSLKFAFCLTLFP